MTRQTQQITVAVALFIVVVLSVPFFYIQDIHVEYDWDIDKSKLSNADFFEADHSGRCAGREVLESDGAVIGCENREAEAVAMPVDFGHCWAYGCDGIIIYYDYNSDNISEMTVASIPEDPLCETVFCGGDPIS